MILFIADLSLMFGKTLAVFLFLRFSFTPQSDQERFHIDERLHARSDKIG